MKVLGRNTILCPHAHFASPRTTALKGMAHFPSLHSHLAGRERSSSIPLPQGIPHQCLRFSRALKHCKPKALLTIYPQLRNGTSQKDGRTTFFSKLHSRRGRRSSSICSIPCRTYALLHASTSLPRQTINKNLKNYYNRFTSSA